MRRSGFSLLEILVSLFVILVGLLGVAALLPIGRSEIMTAAKADRAGTCARAAMRDIVIRQMLDQSQWQSGVALNWSQTVAIDPIGVAQGRSPQFPASGAVWMPRVTLPAFANPAVAERVFTSHDDLLFDMPSERTERPQQIFRTWLRFQGPTNPTSDVTTNVLDLNLEAAEAEGNYSWLATVTPAIAESGLAGPRRQFTVSVVVFFQRDSDPLGERTCTIASVGMLLGGGDVKLDGPAAQELRQGEWILLRGLGSGSVPTFKWYRVVSAAEYDPSSGGSRLVTLAGPDWNPGLNGPSAEAGLFRGAVGVYTQTVEVDR